ncbi:MAG TPA: glycosyltransferase family 2 protein [Longimicrobiales bacterium]
MNRIPVSAIVLTRDEELNLPACLASMRDLVDEIYVVDSGSTDRTVEIARAAGATVTTHEFTGHSAQWQWALANLPLKHQWVLGLDADQRLMPELADELRALFADASKTHDYAGFYVTRRNVFRGKWIRWGGYYPKRFIKLFRRDRLVHEEADLLDHHFRVNGQVGTLANDIVEENLKEDKIDFWIKKHLRYAELLAKEEARRRQGHAPTTVKPALFGDPDQRAEWQKKTWTLLPRFVRPPAYFIWRYFFLLGFLDGKQGFAFHFLHAFWYRLVTDLKMDEQRSDVRTRD